MSRAFGHVLSVRERLAGGLLAADVLATDTVLPLDDISQFGELTGAATITNEDGDTEDVVILELDPEADTLTLESGLAAGWQAGDVVAVSPSIITRYAMVARDGAQDEAIEAVVPSQVAHLLRVGTRPDEDQERVTLEFEEETETWIVVHVWVTAAVGVDLTVTDDTTPVSPVQVLAFDPSDFEVTDAGDGRADVAFVGSGAGSLADHGHTGAGDGGDIDATYATDAELGVVGGAVADHLSDAVDAHDASAISIQDTGHFYSGTEVEAALQELGAAIGGTTIDVEDDTTPVASASTLDFGTGLAVTDNGGGNVTVDAAPAAPTTGSTIVTGRANVTTTTGSIIASRSGRIAVIILALPTNTETIDIGPSGATSGSDFPLAPGASLTLATDAAIHGDAPTATQVIAFVEVYN